MSRCLVCGDHSLILSLANYLQHVKRATIAACDAREAGADHPGGSAGAGARRRARRRRASTRRRSRQAAARALPLARRLPGLPEAGRRRRRALGRRPVGLEPGHLRRPARPELGELHRLHQLPRRRPCSTPTSARRASTASPTRSTAKQPKAQAGQLHRLRRRVDPGHVPDPGEGADRGRAGHPTATATCSRSTRKRCKLYELYRAFFVKGKKGGHWNADSGVIWDLRSAALPHRGLHLGRRRRAADLPRAGPLRRGRRRARSTTPSGSPSRRPAAPTSTPPPTAPATSPTPNAPPMGLRLRLNAGYDISGITGPAHAIAVAMKRYGFIVADNGSNWFFSGTSDQPLGRREPEPAEGDPRLGLRGRAVGGPGHRLLAVAERSRSSRAQAATVPFVRPVDTGKVVPSARCRCTLHPPRSQHT